MDKPICKGERNLRGHLVPVIACPIDEQRTSADLLLMIEFRSRYNEGGKTDRLCSTDFISDASGYTPLCFSAVFI